MTKDPQAEAMEIVRRFVRGRATGAELEMAATRLDLVSMEELWERWESWGAAPADLYIQPRVIAKRIAAYLEGE